MLDTAFHTAAARRLDQAERSREQIGQLSLERPEITLDDAYAIQRVWVEQKIADLEAGVLYMSVGLMEGAGEEDEPSMVDHPVYFCPFCGTKLQTEEEVEAKLSAEAA